MTSSASDDGPRVERPGMISVRQQPSFIRLVYSFALAPGGRQSEHRKPAAAVLAQLKERAPGFGWEDRKILYDYVLPHLADHMNAQDERDGEGEVGHWWRFAGGHPPTWALRVNADREVELTLNSVEFVFFRTGIGMLLLEIDPVSDLLDDWQDALHLSRFYRLPPPEGANDEVEYSEPRSVFARRAPRLIPVEGDSSGAYWAGGLQGAKPCGFGRLIAGLMDELFGDRTWERASVPGLLAPFSALFVDWPEANEVSKFEALYRWRRQLRSSATVHAGDQRDLHAELRTYATDMWLAYSSEGGGFFAGNAPHDDFFDHDLPDHLRRPYAFGYLLALHQRLALSRFSEQIGRVVGASRGLWTSDSPPRDEIALLQDDFLEYLTRCHFVQVLRTANHHANYKVWEEVLEVDAFATEVELELRLLYERSTVAERILADNRRDRLAGRVNAAVLGIAVPTVVLAILAVAYPSGLGLLLTIVLTLTSIISGVGIGWLAATDASGDRRASARGPSA